MICKECGNEILSGTMFCTNCGAKVEAEVQEADSDKTVVLWDEEPQQSKQDEDRTVVLWDEELQQSKQDEDRTVVLWDEEPTQPKQNNGATKNCPNCGIQNEGDAIFCVECGALMVEAKPQPTTQPVAPSSMTPPPMTPPPMTPPPMTPPQMNYSSVQQAKTAKKAKIQKQPKQEGETSGKKKLPIIICAIVVVAVLIIGAVLAITGLPRKTVGNDLVYLKDNEVYMAEGGKFVPELITDSYYTDDDNADYINVYSNIYSGFQYTQDGNYFFYTQDIENGEFDLYYKKADSKESGTKLEAGVSSYQAYSKEKILYMKKGKLYLSDLENKEKIASDMMSYAISKDGKYFYWCEYDDGEYDYHILDMNLKKDEVKIKGVTSMIHMSDDYSEIYYLSDDTLYLLKGLKDKIKISSDVASAYMICSGGAQKFYYFKIDEEKPYTYFDFVKDDVKESSEYSMYADYIKEELKYYDAYVSEYTIYSYSAKTNKSEELVTFLGALETNITNYDQSERMILYRDIDIEEMEKVKLSEILEDYYNSDGDIYLDDIVEYNLLELSSYNLLVGDKIIPISGMGELFADTGMVEPEELCINQETKEIYMSVCCYQDEGNYTYDLYVIPYTAEEAECRLITNDLNPDMISSKQGVYYLYDVDKEGEEGTLFLNGIEIDEDVYPKGLKVSDDAIYYLKDINSDHDEGILCVNKNHKVTEIADDVALNSFVPLKDGDIAYLMDYSFKKSKGDLFVFNGKKSIAVDTDVSTILR